MEIKVFLLYFKNGNSVFLYHMKFNYLTLKSLTSNRDSSLSTTGSPFRASPSSEPLSFQIHKNGVKFSIAELLILTQVEQLDTQGCTFFRSSEHCSVEILWGRWKYFMSNEFSIYFIACSLLSSVIWALKCLNITLESQ